MVSYINIVQQQQPKVGLKMHLQYIIRDDKRNIYFYYDKGLLWRYTGGEHDITSVKITSRCNNSHSQNIVYWLRSSSSLPVALTIAINALLELISSLFPFFFFLRMNELFEHQRNLLLGEFM